MNEEREYFERLKFESRQAYECFKIYIGLSPAERSYAKVAQIRQRSLTLMARYGKKHFWVPRAEAFDAHNERIDREAREEARRQKAEEWETARLEMNERQASIGATLQKLAAQCINKIVRDGGAHLTYREVVLYATEGAKLERLARGEPTEHTMTETGADRAARIRKDARAAFRESVELFPGVPREQLRSMTSELFGVDESDLEM